MATAQNAYSLAWCLWVKSSPNVYAATTDLPEDAAATTLGAFYTRRLINIDAQLVQELPGLFYGMPAARAVEFVLDNSDATFSASTDYRLTPVVLYLYDRNTNTKTTDLTGVITQAKFVNSRVTFTIGAYNESLFEELLPAAVIDPVVGSPCETTDSPGAPIPVVFGEDVPVRAPSIAADTISDPGGYDIVVSHGTVYVKQVRQDVLETAGLERLGAFVGAPGSPTYVNTTTFSVTGDQSARYQSDASFGGMPIRFKTTASGSTYLYSHVTAYNSGVSPHRVTIADALLDSGLNSVSIAGDYMLVRGGYQNVTDGILPVPTAPGADLTVVRLFDGGDAPTICVCDNPSFPVSSTHISGVIQEIVTNSTWGLSTRVAQSVNATSFSAAAVALALAGLTGAVRGALAYDQQQRRAGNVLDELLMMRGMRLYQNDSLEWLIAVDTQPSASSKTFQLGSGDYYGIPVKRILDHGRATVGDAVRNVVLNWSPLGRNLGSQFLTKEYARRTIKSVGTVGRDLVLFNQWIRDQTTAELVAHYIGEKFSGADERLTFVAGQEARDVTLGEVVTVEVPTDGITGDWQVYAIAKTLSEVTLSCFRANSDAYGATSGVVTSDDPTDTETRTSSGAGSNLVFNPEIGPPFVRNASSALEPIDWISGTATATYDYSKAVIDKTLSGHYVRLVASSTETPSTTPLQILGTDRRFPVPSSEMLLPSIYCDQSSGVFLYVEFFDSSGSAISDRLVSLIYDNTDVTPNGWGRYYARVRSPSTAAQMAITWGMSAAATYQFEACQVEAAGRTARRPSPWRRHQAQDQSAKVSATITFNGASTYTATTLIPAGVRVVGVVSRVTSAITLGTATSYSIGTTGNPSAWGTGITNVALNATTDQRNFVVTTETNFPTATSVVVTGNGTITSGTLRLEVEYRTAQVARAA